MSNSDSKPSRPSGSEGPPLKISKLIVDFARPLLDVAGGPRSIDDLRHVMLLATLCWNLPVFERAGAPEWAELLELFDEALRCVPEPCPGLLRRLVAERQVGLPHLPFAVLVEVRGTTLDDCRIHAEAREAPAQLLN